MSTTSRRFDREHLERPSNDLATLEKLPDTALAPWAPAHWEPTPPEHVEDTESPLTTGPSPGISHDISRIDVTGDAPLHRPATPPSIPHLTVQRFSWHDSDAPLPALTRSESVTRTSAPAHTGARRDASGHMPDDPSGGMQEHDLRGGSTGPISGTMQSNATTDASGSAAPDKSIAPSDNFQDQSEEVGRRSFGKKREGLEVYVEAEGIDQPHDFPDGYKWTQVINTNEPKGGSTSPYTDPRPKDDEKPFYWNDAEQEMFPTAFHDVPQRPAPAQGATDWEATLTLNGVDEMNKTAVPVDTVRYGFTQDSDGQLTLHDPEPGEPDPETLKKDFSDWKFE
jgi:hypothetical protein